MGALDPLFAPLTLRHLTIRNRCLSTSHAPGYAGGGDITERYIACEREKARGGVGLVQFGGAAPDAGAGGEGRFDLTRIGDAWAARTIHAAMPDAMRLAAAMQGGVGRWPPEPEGAADGGRSSRAGR